MIKNLLEKLHDFVIRQKLKRKGFTPFKVKQQLNPYANIIAEYKGKEFFNQPFSLVLNTYLKDYGFDPEIKNNGSLVIKICFSGEEHFSCPLYVKKDENNNYNLIITVEEAIAKGYIITPRRKEAN